MIIIIIINELNLNMITPGFVKVLFKKEKEKEKKELASEDKERKQETENTITYIESKSLLLAQPKHNIKTE